jgi:hypothetical protein
MSTEYEWTYQTPVCTEARLPIALLSSGRVYWAKPGRAAHVKALRERGDEVCAVDEYGHPWTGSELADMLEAQPSHLDAHEHNHAFG